MAIRALNPYVGFKGGTAEKAVRFYEKALDAKVLGLMRWSEGPGPDVGPEMKDKVMHCALALGGGQLMVCDEPEKGASAPDSNIAICLELDDNADMKRKFAALAEGGQVTMDIHDAFWGATFGMLRDAFGVRWMFVGPKRS